MDAFPFTLTGPIADRSLGVVVLQTDETLEQDFRQLFTVEEALIYITRVPSGEAVTPETLAEMEYYLSAAAALLPKGARFDALAYGCTSGTAAIGADRVAALVAGPIGDVPVTNPLNAAIAALGTLGVGRLGLVSPYVPSVVESLRAGFEASGLVVPATLSFGEETEANVARIDAASVRAAARALADMAEVDALFLSCTNLRTLDVIDTLEAELGLPVVSSNQALAWHLARLTGMTAMRNPVGQLLKTTLPAGI